MRELKFRVWCKRTQEYHTPIDEEDYDADGENLWLQMCIDTNGRLYFIETSNEDADYEYVTHDCEIIDNQNDDFIIEQYTGLKDKNGKEIYEGDIVHVDWPKTKQPILYDSSNFVVKHEVYNGNKVADSGFTLPSGTQNVEVIGNIHENPELLESK